MLAQIVGVRLAADSTYYEPEDHVVRIRVLPYLTWAGCQVDGRQVSDAALSVRYWRVERSAWRQAARLVEQFAKSYLIAVHGICDSEPGQVTLDRRVET